MAGPRSPFPLRYLDEAIGFLVPRPQVSFPGPRPRPAFRSFVPSFLRSLFTDLSHPPLLQGIEASHTLGIIYTIIYTLVRGMLVLKTRNSLNLISTERGGTKNPLKITNHAQGTVLGLPGTGVLPVLRAFCISVTPKKFLQVRWDASPNPHYYTRGTRLRVCPAVLGQPVFRSIRTWVPT